MKSNRFFHPTPILDIKFSYSFKESIWLCSILPMGLEPILLTWEASLLFLLEDGSIYGLGQTWTADTWIFSPLLLPTELPVHKWNRTELNRRHKDFQSLALPTELLFQIMSRVGFEPTTHWIHPTALPFELPYPFNTPNGIWTRALGLRGLRVKPLHYGSIRRRSDSNWRILVLQTSLFNHLSTTPYYKL